MAVTISDSELHQLKMNDKQFRIELACLFYEHDKMSIGQAAKFAQLDRLDFQAELDKREINIKYSVDDLNSDMQTFEKLGI